MNMPISCSFVQPDFVRWLIWDGFVRQSKRALNKPICSTLGSLHSPLCLVPYQLGVIDCVLYPLEGHVGRHESPFGETLHRLTLNELGQEGGLLAPRPRNELEVVLVGFIVE